MTINNAIKSNVEFAFFWTGERTWRRGTVSEIVIKFRNAGHYLIATFDQGTTALKVQPLKLEMVMQNSNPLSKKISYKIANPLKCTPTIAKTMQLSVNTSSSPYSFPFNIPMTLPHFQSGKHYNLCITNKKETLRVTFHSQASSLKASLKATPNSNRQPTYYNQTLSAIIHPLNLQGSKPKHYPLPHGHKKLPPNKSYSDIGNPLTTTTPFPMLSMQLPPESRRSPLEEKAWANQEGEEQPEGF